MAKQKSYHMTPTYTPVTSMLYRSFRNWMILPPARSCTARNTCNCCRRPNLLQSL